MSHIIDSEFYRDSWGTAEMQEVFDDRKRFQRWLDIEAILAQVQAELGVIPAEAAKEIERNAKIELLDVERIRNRLNETGSIVKSLLIGFYKMPDMLGTTSDKESIRNEGRLHILLGHFN